MGKHASSIRGSQVCSAINALNKNNDGLQFKEIFSADQISSAIEKTKPEFRNRAFSP